MLYKGIKILRFNCTFGPQVPIAPIGSPSIPNDTIWSLPHYVDQFLRDAHGTELALNEANLSSLHTKISAMLASLSANSVPCVPHRLLSFKTGQCNDEKTELADCNIWDFGDPVGTIRT